MGMTRMIIEKGPPWSLFYGMIIHPNFAKVLKKKRIID